MEVKSNNSNSDLVIRARKLLSKNLVSGNGYAYVCPSITRYKHQFLWDSCFHVIVNSHLNIDLAKKEFETLLKNQGQDGFLSHMNYWTKKYSLVDKIVKKFYKDENQSSLTQPPLVAQALRAIFERSKDKDFLMNYLSKVRNYYDYLFNWRIFKDDDVPLLNIIHSWESGIDNCPIYDKALGIKSAGGILTIKWLKSLIKQLKVLKNCNWDMEKIREENYFLYKDLLFNCTYVQGCRDLSYLYKEVGKTADAEACEKRALNLEEAIIKHCWNPEKELFFGIFGTENIMDDVKSALSFMPLTLQRLPYSITIALVEEHLLNEKEFWSKYPVPSVALDEPSYTEKGLLLWRGPTWINTNWFIIKGLMLHSFEHVAVDLTQKTIDLVKKSGFREFFSPNTGKGKGARNFSWSTLVIDLETIKNDDIDYFLNREYTKIKRAPN